MKQHPTYKDLWISEDGRVFRYRRELKGSIDSAGYAQIRIHRVLRERRHVLVLETYHGLRPSGLVSRHKDGNPANDHKDNLEWGTQHDNTLDTVRHGKSTRGSKNPSAKLTENQALEIKIRRLAGEKGSVLAREFGISQQSVNDIRIGRVWGWMKIPEKE